MKRSMSQLSSQLSSQPKRAKVISSILRKSPSEPVVSLALPLLGKKPLPYSTRSVEDIYSDIHDAEDELEDIGAEEVFDEFERTGFSVGKADPEEFKKANAAYKKAVDERDNLLDLIKHKYMKWVDGNEREHATKENTSAY